MANDDPTHPDNWYSDTLPLVAVQSFAKADVSVDDIKNTFKEHEIQTLADLRDDRSFCVTAFILENKWAYFINALSKACKRIRKTVEEVLGGDHVWENDCLPQTFFDLYTPDAVSVVPDGSQALDNGLRQKQFTLVLGSSGSGKTMFALRCLPTLLFEDDTSYFCVHFQATKALMLAYSKGKTFPEAVASIVQDLITEKLSSNRLFHVTVINLHLHVIVDEAGGEHFQEFLDAASKLQFLVDFVKRNLCYDFQKGLHITVVGTGLDATTAGIQSVTETIKFRMKPWNVINFEALLKQSQHSNPDLAMNTIRDFPILEDLLSNARCAYFLLISLQDVGALGSNRLNAVVPLIVGSVVDRYRASNSLTLLASAKQEFATARSVFRALDRSTRHKDVPFFPQFHDMEYKKHRLIPNCLVDIHVEKNAAGQLVFVGDHRFSLSVSPAMVLVLMNLLNLEQHTWDWHRFESIVMLSELKRMIVMMNGMPNHLDRLVLQLDAPLPEPDPTNTFSVPQVGESTVIMNGRDAEYADVMAPFRLVQAKFSMDDSNTIKLDIQEEMNNMGLTKSSDHMMKQFLTDVIYTKVWKSQCDVPDSVVVADRTVMLSTKREFRHECYPLDVLNSRRVGEKLPVMVGALEQGIWKTSLFITKNERRERFVRVTFDQERPVTAVFATNCIAYQLITTRKAKKSLLSRIFRRGTINATDEQPTVLRVLISPDDVDWEGKLLGVKKSEVVGLITELRENVELRFLFFGRH